MDVLDNPVWGALSGPQRALGSVGSKAARYGSDVSPFAALASEDDPEAWGELAELSGPGELVVLVRAGGPAVQPPEGWVVYDERSGVQMVGDRMDEPGNRAVEPPPVLERPVPLGPKDADEMLGLVELAQPGPFLRRTVDLGGYLGIRRHQRLVAMAGERFRPSGYGEISAVATHPEVRRQGLASHLVRHVAAAIAGRGDLPILHVSTTNVDAIRLYEYLGFTLRRSLSFAALSTPSAPARA